MGQPESCDLAILGGGLAGALIALALTKQRPELKILLIEATDKIGGDHIWSFFESDIAKGSRWLLEPLVCHSWAGYDVAFPAHSRHLSSPYHSILSERLDRVARERVPPESLMLQRRINASDATSVSLDNGVKIEAKGVIDARGPGRIATLDCGWQKFVGHEMLMEEPHGLIEPIVMDATVEQIDGYRFIYVLPFAPNRLFIEDTYYSATPQLDVQAISRRIAGYAIAKGWKPAAVVREEQGALPVVMSGDFEAYWRSGGEGRAKAGMRAGMFHPTTGYTLPDAVRTAIYIAGLEDLSGIQLERTLHDWSLKHWKERSFYRMLDRMMFRAATPENRYRILERFYRLDRRLIGRFYAARSTRMDQFRILAGRPPVPVTRAVSAMLGGGA